MKSDVLYVHDHERGYSPKGEPIAGAVVVMKDGTRWFHPYNGRAPQQVSSEVRFQYEEAAQ